MVKYAVTNIPGTSRRRAKDIIIHNPAVPMNGRKPTAEEIPMITFIMEDRIIMADGSETLIPAGELTLKLDEKILSKQFPKADTATGNFDTTKNRYGFEIMAMIISALEDVFISSSMERDKELTKIPLIEEPVTFPDAVSDESSDYIPEPIVAIEVEDEEITDE